MAKKASKTSFDDLAQIATGRSPAGPPVDLEPPYEPDAYAPLGPRPDEDDIEPDPGDEDDDQTITIQDYTPRTPPGAISMADRVEDLPEGKPHAPSLEELEETTGQTLPPRPQPLDIVEDRSHAQLALDGDIMPPGQSGEIRYESRIRVLEAFQYPGNVTHAPAWIDRNWVGWGDWDPVRNIEAGPALRVPTARGDVAIARPGDYVVKQEVILARGVPADIQVEVWNRDQFERNFIPDVPEASVGRALG
jgi:hypothetical protein